MSHLPHSDVSIVAHICFAAPPAAGRRAVLSAVGARLLTVWLTPPCLSEIRYIHHAVSVCGNATGARERPALAWRCCVLSECHLISSLRVCGMVRGTETSSIAPRFAHLSVPSSRELISLARASHPPVPLCFPGLALLTQAPAAQAGYRSQVCEVGASWVQKRDPRSLDAALALQVLKQASSL